MCPRLVAFTFAMILKTINPVVVIILFSGLCAGLTIGTEQSFYSIREDEGSLEVCIDVLLGSIPSSDTYTISYTTSEYTAEGNYKLIFLY